MSVEDTAQLRKQRGAFFTPYAIADFLVEHALGGLPADSCVLDPTCGEGVFLLAAASRLGSAAAPGGGPRLYGMDIHPDSLGQTRRLLAEHGHQAELVAGDFFNEPTPDELGARLPLVDAVVGNPPFVRYHDHRGDVRRRATSAALAQGVQLSGLASSWAAVLVHASAFLKPEGRIAIVLPAELLSVGYAEPIRQWLRRRFQAVHLVLFDRLQFTGADEQVVLLVARGSGGCSAFSLVHVNDASDLAKLRIFDSAAFTPQADGKWTDLLVSDHARGILRQVEAKHFTSLSTYATTELGTVTGANNFFTLSEGTRDEYSLDEGRHVVRTVPPGSRHLKGLHFTANDWEHLRADGERVWMLYPTVNRRPSTGGFARYLALGEKSKVNEAYKCSIRDPWWKPPVQPAPNFFFTYMSHVTPRLIRNQAEMTFLNSMHGVRLKKPSKILLDALPSLALNTITMLGAELYGRTYGGGVLKMEPREAANLPVPVLAKLNEAWKLLEDRRLELDALIRDGKWGQVTAAVDEELLTKTIGLPQADLQVLRNALARLRARRQRRAADAS